MRCPTTLRLGVPIVRTRWLATERVPVSRMTGTVMLGGDPRDDTVRSEARRLTHGFRSSSVVLVSASASRREPDLRRRVDAWPSPADSIRIIVRS